MPIRCCLVLAIFAVAGLPAPALAVDWDRLGAAAEELLDLAEDALDAAGHDADRFFDDARRELDALVASPLPPSTGWLSSDLMGAPVNAPDGQRLAVLDDLVVSPDGDVPLALLRIDGRLGLGGELAAIEFDRLTLADGTTPANPAFVLAPEDLAALPPWRIDAGN